MYKTDHRPGDPGEATLREMLVRENALRLAPDTQRAYESAEGGTVGVDNKAEGDNVGAERGRFEDWLEVTDDLQRRVVREFLHRGAQVNNDFERDDESTSVGDGGAARKEQLLLRAFRSATAWYPSLRSIPLYVRFNRARAGRLAPGDNLPDAAMLRLSDGFPAGLLSLLDTTAHGTGKTLLIAGSIS